MMKMSFSRGLGIAVLAAGIFSSCETPEPRDPRDSIPGNREYYNEALKFSIRYPGLLNLKVEDREGVDMPGIVLKLQYPGNDFTVFELITRDPGWRVRLHKGMVAGSELKEQVGGVECEGFDIDLPDTEGVRKRVIAEHLDRLYVFTGKGETFDEVLESFDFLEPDADPKPANDAGGDPGQQCSKGCRRASGNGVATGVGVPGHCTFDKPTIFLKCYSADKRKNSLPPAIKGTVTVVRSPATPSMPSSISSQFSRSLLCSMA